MSTEQETLLAKRALELNGVVAASLVVDGTGVELLAIEAEGFVTGPDVREALARAGTTPPFRIVIVPRGTSLEDIEALVTDQRAAIYEFAVPTTECEIEVAHVWAEVLGRSEIGLDDDILDVGGDSLGVIEIALRLEERFHVELDLGAVFAAGTVRRLAATLEHGNGRYVGPAAT